MSVRVDTSSLIPGACVVGNRGLGTLGSVVRTNTATGAHGPGYLYNDWQDSGDDGKEFRGLIVTPPASGSLFAYEDGSFDFTAPADGSYSFVYRLYVDGVDLGTATASITVGAGSGVTAAAAGTGAITYTGTAAVAASIVDAPPPGGALTNDEMRQMFVWVSEIARIHGLVVGSPLVVTPTSRQAGPISQSISESGSTVTVSRA